VLGVVGGGGGTIRAAARDANLLRALRRHWNNRKYGTGKVILLHTRKNFSENYSQIRRTPSKMSPNAVLGLKR